MIRPRSSGRVRCETDDWTFDPRYTQGRCPICGWTPEGVASAPRWLSLVNRLDWDMLGLLVLADVLVLVGLIVAHVTGIIPTHVIASAPPSGGAAAASSARLH